MKRILIAIATLTAVSPALGMNYRAWTAPELLQRWMVLNEDCRGGAGDEQATRPAVVRKPSVAADPPVHREAGSSDAPKRKARRDGDQLAERSQGIARR